MKTNRFLALLPLCFVIVASPIAAQTPDAQPANSGQETSVPGTKAASSPDADTSAKTDSAPDAATDELRASLATQRELLDDQTKRLAAQRKLLDDQTKKLDAQAKLIAEQGDALAKQSNDLDGFRELLRNMQAEVDRIAQARGEQLSQQEIALRARLQKVEQQVAEIPEDPTKDMKDFPDSIHIPGTSSKLRIGGFVKMAAVDSLDPIGSTDRFVANSIPVEPDPSINEQVVLSVRQSRLNFEMRDLTSHGTLRAFIEADFDGGSGNKDLFNLRHAYGQYRNALAGKTWSTLMDLASAPEEIDFEGLNGRINVRQTQVRFFPQIGRDLNFLIALEDPSPDVSGGSGVSRIPDLVMSFNRTWFTRWNGKASAVFRQIRAKSDTGASGLQTEMGWGLSLSGRTGVPWFNANDNFAFQINYGNGLGRYVRDLNGLGLDAVFDARGNLRTLKTFAGYVSTQHWWTSQWRSNLVYGWVRVDDLGFQGPDAYHSTSRASANVIFSPVPKVDVGWELIWGRRENQDGKSASAKQMQAAFTYRY